MMEVSICIEVGDLIKAIMACDALAKDSRLLEREEYGETADRLREIETKAMKEALATRTENGHSR